MQSFNSGQIKGDFNGSALAQEAVNSGTITGSLWLSGDRDTCTGIGPGLVSATPMGEDGVDRLKGGLGLDKPFGDNGDDVLSGGTGDDYLAGWFGNDQMFGPDDNDNMNGFDGNDTLTGGPGNEKLSGGNGADLFIFGVGDGRDVLYSFTSG